jgi:hypothetical protein
VCLLLICLGLGQSLPLFLLLVVARDFALPGGDRLQLHVEGVEVAVQAVHLRKPSLVLWRAAQPNKQVFTLALLVQNLGVEVAWACSSSRFPSSFSGGSMRRDFTVARSSARPRSC